MKLKILYISFFLGCCLSILGQVNSSTPEESKDPYGVEGVAFTRDGKTLVSVGGSGKGNIKIWDIAGASLQRSITCECVPKTVSISPDGKEFVVAGGSMTPVYEMATGEIVMELGSTFNALSELAIYSPDGKTIVTSNLGEIKTWNSQNGKKIREFSADTKKVSSIAFSPDGKVFATGGWDNSIRFWDITSGKETKSLLAHTHWVTSLAFSVDGKMLASGDQDTKIRVWDVKTGKPIQELTDEDLLGSSIDSITFAPRALSGDVTIVMAANLSWIITLDVAKGRWKQTKAKEIIESLVVSPDGNMIAFGYSDKSLTLLDLRSKKEIPLVSK